MPPGYTRIAATASGTNHAFRVTSCAHARRRETAVASEAIMKIAICTDISQFHLDRLRDRDWSQRFLGSAWVTSLYERQGELGIEVASGDIALQRVKAGEWQASEVHVVQEMDARHGVELCQLGAVPSVLTMLESPLVAYRSVDRLLRLRAQFAHCIGPHAIFERSPALRQSRHWRLAFPSYWRR